MPKNDEAKQLVEAKLPDDVVIELDGQAFSFPRDQDDWPTGAIVAAGRVSTGRAQYDEVVNACSAKTSGRGSSCCRSGPSKTS